MTLYYLSSFTQCLATRLPHSYMWKDVLIGKARIGRCELRNVESRGNADALSSFLTGCWPLTFSFLTRRESGYGTVQCLDVDKTEEAVHLK